MFFSRSYNFVRSRQLEGTYPGDPKLGMWGITSNRVSFGWGRPTEEEWPYFRTGKTDEDFNVPEPDGIDQAAKRHRIRSYQRVRNSRQCRKILAKNEKAHDLFLKEWKTGRRPLRTTVPGFLEMKGAFEITRQFVEAPQGIVVDPPSDARIIGAHAVPFLRDLRHQGALEFVNSWGETWGYHGIGSMPYSFFDRWMTEAWAIDESEPSLPRGTGIIEFSWDLPDPLDNQLHGLETYDADGDERIGWAFSVHRDGHLDVEELYVRPAYRGQGHGNRLVERLLTLAEKHSRPLRAWIPFADCEPGNRPALNSIIAKLGLGVHRSGVPWAPYRATSEEPNVIHFPLVRIPPKAAHAAKDEGSSPGRDEPRGEWETLRGSVISFEEPFGPAASVEEWEAFRP